MRSVINFLNKNMKKNSKLFRLTYRFVDEVFQNLDNKKIRSETNLLLIPPARFRYGGQSSLKEYAHTVGIFQTLINIHSSIVDNINILDFGCGTGKFVACCSPFLGENGKYVGIDTTKEDIDICKNIYPKDKYKFVHVNAKNPNYNLEGDLAETTTWPVPNNSFDVILALSVFTHLNERDAVHYFKVIHQKLKTDGCAILTFFLIDRHYSEERLKNSRWFFDKQYPGSRYWFYPSWADIPEAQIGVSFDGIKKLAGNLFNLEKVYQGHWKAINGIFLQDILIFRGK